MPIIKAILISHKNKGKPHFPDIKAYHHTIYARNLLNYHATEYKLNQTKIINDQLYTVGINEGVKVLDKSIKTLSKRRFKNKKILYPGKSKIIKDSIATQPRPFLYFINKWYAFKKEDHRYYQSEIEPQNDFEYINKKTRYWYSDSLHAFLEEILYRDILYMLGYIDILASESSFYISIQPGITSQISKHSHRESQDTFPLIFDVYFTSNLVLPSFLSIGNAVSIGYGTLIKV